MQFPGGQPTSAVSHKASLATNIATLGEAAVSLQGTNGPFLPIAGQFSVLLQATFGAAHTNAAALGQIGTIPTTAQSLMFWANTSLSGLADDMGISFNGSMLSYSATGTGSGYTIYGANVAAFSGQTGELLFTAFNNTYAEIDNIAFLSQPIPEASTFALFDLG